MSYLVFEFPAPAPCRDTIPHHRKGISPMPNLYFEPPAQSAIHQAVAPPDTKPRQVCNGSSPVCDEAGGSPHLGGKPTERTRRGRWGWPWIGAESAIDLPRANLTVL